MNRRESISIPVSVGELIDKLTILEIKSQRMMDESKLVNVRRELNMLRGCVPPEIESSAEFAKLKALLRTVNETLWDIEDRIRACEHKSDFGAQFINLARSVYRTNDERANLKRQINELVGSDLVEEKSYSHYD